MATAALPVPRIVATERPLARTVITVLALIWLISFFAGGVGRSGTRV